MALTQQVPEPVRSPVTVQIGVYGGSSECFGTRHPGFGPEKPVSPWTKKAQLRAPRPVISSMGARHDPTSEKGLSQETVPPLENQPFANHTKQMVWWICSGLAGAEYVVESKMSRHREIQTSVRITTPFTKTPFSRSRLKWVGRMLDLLRFICHLLCP